MADEKAVQKFLKDYPHATREEAESFLKKQDQRSRRDSISKTLEEATASEKLKSGMSDVGNSIGDAAGKVAHTVIGKPIGWLNNKINEKGTSEDSGSTHGEQESV